MSRHSIRPPQGSSYSSPSSSAYLSRSSYPLFLSLPETLKLQLNWAWRGLVDASRWDIVLRMVADDSEIRSNTLKSLLLNSLSLTSIYTFDLLLLPLVRDQQKWLHRNVGWFYQILWLLPVVSASLYLNSSWCTVIAKRTYTLQHGTRHAAPPPTYTGMLTAIATSAYRVVMMFTSIVVSFGLGYIPVVGPFLEFLLLCWIDAYYCFEFIWIARGYSLAQRVRHLEERWAYYFAFGFPSAALCMWGSGLANAALFALILPAYIMLAMKANPVPIHPYSPITPGTDAVVRHPSPFVPIRVPIFAPIIFINDWIVRILSVGGGGRAPTIKGLGGRSRGISEGAESVEEGDALVGLNNLGPSRVAMGIRGLGRRKRD